MMLLCDCNYAVKMILYDDFMRLLYEGIICRYHEAVIRLLYDAVMRILYDDILLKYLEVYIFEEKKTVLHFICG